MLGIVGLSIDWGKLVWNVHQSQNAADAAALAGAQWVKIDQERARTRAIALGLANVADQRHVSLDRNVSNDPAGELVLGRWIRQTREFIPTEEAPNAVLADVRRQGQRADAPKHKLFFGPLFGTNEVGSERGAIAVSLETTGAGIICLDENPAGLPKWTAGGTGLLLDGTAVIDLRGPDGMMGDIQVNSPSQNSPWSALRAGGQIWAGDINVTGTTNPDPNDLASWEKLYADPSFPPNLNPLAPAVPDPLAGMAPPVFDATDIPLDASGNPYSYTINDDVVAAAGGTLTLSPGYYPGGINLTSPDSQVILTGGPESVYIVGGGSDGKSGVVMTGGSLTGYGAMIYVSGDPGGTVTGADTKYGEVNIGGGAVVNLSSRGDAKFLPTVDGEAGVAIWQDRNNDNYAKIIGTSGSMISGTLYFPNCAMEVGGDADQMGNQLLAGALWVHGRISLGIAYDGRNMVKAYRSALVR